MPKKYPLPKRAQKTPDWKRKRRRKRNLQRKPSLLKKLPRQRKPKKYPLPKRAQKIPDWKKKHPQRRKGNNQNPAACHPQSPFQDL